MNHFLNRLSGDVVSSSFLKKILFSFFTLSGFLVYSQEQQLTIQSQYYTAVEGAFSYAVNGYANLQNGDVFHADLLTADSLQNRVESYQIQLPVTNPDFSYHPEDGSFAWNLGEQAVPGLMLHMWISAGSAKKDELYHLK